MKSLAWIAVFSLQLGMFVCGAGIDVCHVPSSTSHIESSQKANTSHHSILIDQTCSAHAAHVFLGQPDYDQNQPAIHVESINVLVSLNLPEFFNLIEQPPKFLHS